MDERLQIPVNAHLLGQRQDKQLKTIHVAGPQATAVGAAHGDQNGVYLLSFGGFSKLEEAALRLLASGAGYQPREAVQAAREVLDLCTTSEATDARNHDDDDDAAA